MLADTLVRNVADVVYATTDAFTHTLPTAEDRRELISHGPANTHILVTGAAERVFTGGQRASIDGLLGKIVPVRPSQIGGTEWYHLTPGDRGIYLQGARVNPTPIDGHYYRELYNIVGDGESNGLLYLLRYNDEFHRPLRAHPDYPWTIVEDPTNRSGMNVGHQRYGDGPDHAPVLYVEVNWGTSAEAVDNEGIDLDLIFDTPAASEPEDPSVFITNDVTGHTLGKAEVEVGITGIERVRVDPPKVEGELYLGWRDDRAHYNDHVCLLQSGVGDLWQSLGSYHRAMDGTTHYTDDMYGSGPAGEPNFHYCKAAWEEPHERADDEAVVAALVEQELRTHEAFEDLNDALNDLARQQSWCGEYERTMQLIGMRDRHSGGRLSFGDEPETRHAWDIEIDVDFTVELDGSSRVNDAIESAVGMGSVNDSITASMSTSITVHGIVAATADEAREMIGTGEVENELDNQLYISSQCVDDWTITDVNEDEDFDWDDYDD